MTLVTGWVRERDRERLDRMVDEAGSAALTELEPGDAVDRLLRWAAVDDRLKKPRAWT